MKYWVLILIHLYSSGALAQDPKIFGKVEKTTGCADKAMVWLSLDKENYQERLLLLHTEVPQGGTFQFHVQPGHYQVRASDKVGCEYFKRVHITQEQAELSVRLVKK